MKELKQVIQLMMKEKRDIYLSILFGYLAGMTAVGLFAANGYLISRAAVETPLYVLIMMVAIVKLGSFLRAGSRYAERYFSHRATFTMLANMRVHFYDKVESLSPSLIQKYRSGDMLARIVGDVESLQNFFLRVIYPPLIMVLVFLSTVLFVSFYSFSIVLLLIIGLILTGIVIPAWFAHKQKKISNDIREHRADFSTELTEWMQGFRELKIHQQLDEKEQLLFDTSETYMNGQEKESLQASYNQSVNVALSAVITWLVLVVGAYLVANGSLDGLFLAMLVMISLTVFEHSTPMAAFPVYYEDSEKAAKRLFNMDERHDEDKTDVTTTKYWTSAPSITFKNVSFSYPNEQRKVTEGLNLELPAGSKTAIVGASGSGKSTLFNLLLKLYSPDEGEIYFDGEKRSQMDQEEIWKRTNVVLQENHFFYGTIKDNLLIEEGSLTDGELSQVLKTVQLAHFVLTDRVMEKGQNLSGGEKQRLAMARAVIKDAPLWLLDEPTSSLDSWTEQQLYETLYQQAKDDTVIIISHRLSGLEKMDQIVVMDQGEVVEVGSFAELMEKKGYFYRLKQIEASIIRTS
ncbi:thiol reductant ABC exporter subunit CydC [Desertibacillus haloalkaliphilus]|uniref:thiol reductant ABC exporter subunit CydC n=1 Tax=Desertibacillus haloalkaliphilus TaxID=1328930 RepID=UPI001C275D10|nr:thiol reductant ABC exporter subunit CydC [Desertibacillus haloalkaliphilus]MBU8906437.1 thiol reductant ABC exporter subunit CydC [Desertibacillus haloalkaliphilus]